jgi:F-type H+-transporting ATPase subunit alpha
VVSAFRWPSFDRSQRSLSSDRIWTKQRWQNWRAVKRLTEILKQPQYKPMDVEKQVLLIWAATNGFADDIPVDQVGKFETELLRFVENSRPGLLQSLREKKAVTDEIKSDLEQTLKDFKDVWAEKTEAVAA